MDPSSERRRQGDDYDHLTFSEAGIRLRDAIDEQRRLVAELCDADPDAVVAARRRLDGLLAAAERNRPGRSGPQS